MPITVGRDKSIKAINDAYKADKLVGVVAQKDSNVEDPTVSDLEDIGTVAKIIKLIKMPDGGTTVATGEKVAVSGVAVTLWIFIASWVPVSPNANPVPAMVTRSGP